MAEHDQAQSVVAGWSTPEPFDDIRDLYVAQVAKFRATIATEGAGEPAGALLSGEVQVYGRVEAGLLAVERVRRVALYGVLEQPDRDPRLGLLSLVGPLDGIVQAAGSAAGFQLQLHYEALSTELPPLVGAAGCVQDAVFPEVETIQATLKWTAEDTPAGAPPVLRVDLSTGSLVEPKLGYVRAVALGPTSLPFYPVGTGKVEGSQHRSLLSNFAPQVGGCLANHDTVVRTMLPLRFVNFGLRPNHPKFAQLESLCQAQIDSIDQVWGHKAALQISVQGDIAHGDEDQIKRYGVLLRLREEELLHPIAGQVSADPDHLHVYVVERFADDSHGGGIAYNCGVAGAYCILDARFLSLNKNRFLLAHELGHVLGLDHPDSGAGNAGSSASVMQPNAPDKSINTLRNCLIFTQAQAATQLNPIVNIPAPSAFACFATDRDD